MNWQSEINGFLAYLQLEKSLAEHTITSYMHDVESFLTFCDEQGITSISAIHKTTIRDYLNELNELGIAQTTQARLISSLRSFFNYATIEQITQINPAIQIKLPKLARKLPDTLNHHEVQLMIQAINVSKQTGHRNRAIIELLYGSGLRVSECANLTLSNLYRKEEFIRIIGKGNKERLVPIHQRALHEIELYEAQMRNHINIKPKQEDFLFLSMRGNQLSRIMIYNVVKESAHLAGIQKSVSPHTLRHSFATELIKNGANLRAVQDMLGHASILTTEIYTHLDQQHLRKTVEHYHPLYQ